MNSPQAGELPALPETTYNLGRQGGSTSAWEGSGSYEPDWVLPEPAYTAEQMHAFRAEGIAAALAGLPEQEAVGEVDGEGHVTFFDPIPEGGAKLYAARPGDERAPTAQAGWMQENFRAMFPPSPPERAEPVSADEMQDSNSSSLSIRASCSSWAGCRLRKL